MNEKTNTIINVASKVKELFVTKNGHKIRLSWKLKIKEEAYGRNTRNKRWLFNTKPIIKK